jgi:hypothetical protein
LKSHEINFVCVWICRLATQAIYTGFVTVLARARNSTLSWASWIHLMSAPASYSGGPGLKSRLGNGLSWMRLICFTQSLLVNAGIVP